MQMLIYRIIVFLFNVHYITTDTSSHNAINYPPLWNTVPSSLSDYPLVHESSSHYRLIDPWFYPHRLGLYKILIGMTTPLMPFCSSSNNASNILFALPSQFGWQYRSNRLFTNGTLTMSLDSWWAAANYYLSIIPFLSAINVGIIPQEPFRIVKYENFCSNSIECLDQATNSMKQWHKFFIHLKQIHKRFTNTIIDDKILDNLYLGPLWSAYTASITEALPLVESKKVFLPSNLESLFGDGWARLINLISMARKNTNLFETIRNQHAFLPDRMLLDSDRFTDDSDLPESVRKSLKFVISFRFDQLSYIEKLWKKLTCNYEARVHAQRTLEFMAISKLFTLKHLSQAALYAFLFRCDSSSKNDL